MNIKLGGMIFLLSLVLYSCSIDYLKKHISPCSYPIIGAYAVIEGTVKDSTDNSGISRCYIEIFANNIKINGYEFLDIYGNTFSEDNGYFSLLIGASISTRNIPDSLYNKVISIVVPVTFSRKGYIEKKVRQKVPFKICYSEDIRYENIPKTNMSYVFLKKCKL